MGSSVSTCDASSTFDPLNDGGLLLKKDKKPPNFMQKIHVKCQATNSNSIVNAYMVDVELDLVKVVSMGVAASLVLILIVWMIMKMRHHGSRVSE